MATKAIEAARDGLPSLEFEEVDITVRPDVAVRYGVMTTPAIAINGRLEFRGVPRKEALLARLHAAAQQSGHADG